MVLIRFPDVESRKRALAYLIGRFPGKSWASGEVAVPEAALAELAVKGFQFRVEGPVTHDRLVPLRATLAAAL